MVKTSPSNAGGAGSIPGRGAKIPHASWPRNQNIKQKQHCNKFNKDFNNDPHQKNLKKGKKETHFRQQLSKLPNVTEYSFNLLYVPPTSGVLLIFHMLVHFVYHLQSCKQCTHY